MKTLTQVNLNENERIVYEALKQYHELSLSQIARNIAQSDIGQGKTTNAWEKKVRVFKEKYPNWNKPSFVVTGSTTIEADYILRNRELKAQIQKLTADKNLIIDETNKKVQHYVDLAESIPALPIIKTLEPLISITANRKLRIEDAVLICSDFHINRVIDKEQMEGYNEFNFDIFANRFWFLLQEVIKIVNAQRYDKTIYTLHIDFLGDMFNDIFREENMRTNQFSPVEAVLIGSYVLAQGVALLTPHFKKIKITGIVGNEPRWDKTKPAKEKFNNMDYDAYQFMSIALRDYIASGQVEFHIPVSPEVVVERMGKKFLLTHGDAVKSSLGIPLYGILRDYMKQQELRRKHGGIHYMELGHFHHPAFWDNKILLNSSLCGIDEYGKNDLHVTSDASQKFFGINEKYGISWLYDIQLTNAKENGFVYTTKHLSTAGIGASWNDFVNQNRDLQLENTLNTVDIFKTNKEKRIKK